MIIDCHTHITSPASGMVAADHLAVLDIVNVCFVLPAPDSSSKDVNRAVSEYVRQHKSRMVGFALINPLSDKVSSRTINFIRRDLELGGIVLYCPDFNCHPAHSRAMRLYEIAQELKMPVFFHSGSPLGPKAVLDFAQPYLLDEVARTFPNLKIIIGSMGMPFVDQTISMITKHPNVYADMTLSPRRTWEVFNTITLAYEREVMGKLLFGSGYPLGSPAAYIEALLGFNKLFANSSLPAIPREAIREAVERDSAALLGFTLPLRA